MWIAPSGDRMTSFVPMCMELFACWKKLVMLNARSGTPLPVNGDGQNVRDWLFVEDHCEAIRQVLARGKAGETYNVGGSSEKRNIEIVEAICSILDQCCPNDSSMPHR